VAGELGICGLDPRGRPVHASEIRACWVSRAPIAPPPDGLFELVPPRR
jgi:hypothetical protein